MLETFVCCTETTLFSVAGEQKQRKRLSTESTLNSCGSDVVARNRHGMTVSGEEVAEEEKADQEQDATDDVVEALGNISDTSMSRSRW